MTVNANGGSLIQTVAAGNQVIVTLVNNGTTTGVWDAAYSVSSGGTGGGSGTVLSNSITQASHGFSVGQVLYYTGSAYALAKADADSTSEVLGIVSSVTSSSVFVLSMDGYVSGLSGLTAGTTYYLSDTTAGGLTSTQPSTVGHISKPVLVADSATSGYVIQSRGVTIATTYSGSTKSAWSGYQTIASGWTNTSATLSAPTAGGTVSTTSLNSNGITAVSFGTSAGITCTLPATGYYMVYATVTYTTNANNTAYVALVDGSGNFINKGIGQVNISTGYLLNTTLTGLYNATSTTASFQIYTANGGGYTVSIINTVSNTTTVPSINWTIVQL